MMIILREFAAPCARSQERRDRYPAAHNASRHTSRTYFPVNTFILFQVKFAKAAASRLLANGAKGLFILPAKGGRTKALLAIGSTIFRLLIPGCFVLIITTFVSVW
jgi:hypothetical protein